MTTDTTIVKPTTPLFDEARLAIAGFLARYSGHPDQLRRRPAPVLQRVCKCDLEVLAAGRGHLELYARTMEERGLSRATIGRRLSTVAASTASPSARCHGPTAASDGGARSGFVHRSSPGRFPQSTGAAEVPLPAA
jgi:hypothetical protein